jgi:hypothetical protein
MGNRCWLLLKKGRRIYAEGSAQMAASTKPPPEPTAVGNEEHASIINGRSGFLPGSFRSIIGISMPILASDFFYTSRPRNLYKIFISVHLALQPANEPFNTDYRR